LNFISILVLINFGDDKFTFILFFSIPMVIKIVFVGK